MSVRDDMAAAQIAAQKERDTRTLSTLRLVLSAIKNEQIKRQKELTDEDVQQVVKTQVKQLADALQDFQRGNRDDLVAQTREEIAILTRYLPVQMPDEELQALVTRIVADMGAVSPGDIGKVMGMVMKEVRGAADGSRVRELVSAALRG